MTRPHGNQHYSRKVDLMDTLGRVRVYLRLHILEGARFQLAKFWREYAKAPAGTRRRWKCGR
jgi:hypothetical protein